MQQKQMGGTCWPSGKRAQLSALPLSEASTDSAAEGPKNMWPMPSSKKLFRRLSSSSWSTRSFTRLPLVLGRQPQLVVVLEVVHLLLRGHLLQNGGLHHRGGAPTERIRRANGAGSPEVRELQRGSGLAQLAQPRRAGVVLVAWGQTNETFATGFKITFASTSLISYGI